MSYCQDEWISEYTYRAILNYRGSTPAKTALPASLKKTSAVYKPGFAPETETQLYLLASGTFSDTLILDPWAMMEFPVGHHDAPGEGQYRLSLMAPDGAVLFERHFEPDVYEPDLLPGMSGSKTLDEIAAFYQIVPWHPETAFVQIWREDELLAERFLSGHAPEVELLSPTRGDHWANGENYWIEWQARDADDDPLWFDVAFSLDEGETWQVFATRLQENFLEVNSDQFPGAENALIRVYASDGLLTTFSTSMPFSIDAKDPEAVINFPEDDSLLPEGMPILLSGLAYDYDDGMLTGEALSWSSDQDGFLGNGDKVLVTLSPGQHILTLMATDSHGNSVSAVAHVVVR
jgi:hypothetical protein